MGLSAFGVDFHKQKRPLGWNKLCETQSKSGQNDHACLGDFQILSEMHVLSEKQNQAFQKVCLNSCLLSHSIMFVIPREFSASSCDPSAFKNKQLGVCSPILFFSPPKCQIRSGSVKVDSSQRSVCSSVIVFCLLCFASLRSPLLWPGFLPFDL